MIKKKKNKKVPSISHIFAIRLFYLQRYVLMMSLSSVIIQSLSLCLCV